MTTPRQSVHVRLPATLLAELRKRADDEGVSVNTLIATLLAGAIRFDLKKGEVKPASKRVFLASADDEPTIGALNIRDQP